MGYVADREQFGKLFSYWEKEYDIWAPKRFHGGGRFSDTDAVRYTVVKEPDEIEFDEKSAYSWKETVLPPSETLFYYTQTHVEEAQAPAKKRLVFLRSCDLAAVRRMDQIYLKNGDPDYYYERKRDGLAFVMIGCPHTCENGFCVSMGTNASDDYDMSIDLVDGKYRLDFRRDDWDAFFAGVGAEKADVTPARVTENKVQVSVPENLTFEVGKSSMWNQYDKRCINCGRCNFVCPTCTCFTMMRMEMWARDAACRLRAWSTAIPMWPAAQATGRKTGSVCASRHCTKFWILRRDSDTRCASDAADATISVRSIFLFPTLSITWKKA